MDHFTSYSSIYWTCIWEQVVNAINNWIPMWVMNGFKSSGSCFTSNRDCDFNALLPIKTYWPYFIIGFVLLAYGAQFFSVLGVALVGFGVSNDLL